MQTNVMSTLAVRPLAISCTSVISLRIYRNTAFQMKDSFSLEKELGLSQIPPAVARVAHHTLSLDLPRQSFGIRPFVSRRFPSDSRYWLDIE